MSLPPYDEALDLVLSRIHCLAVETVPREAAMGRVLCEDIVADRDQPPFHRSAMDGFAVRSSEIVAGASFEIIAEIPAGGAVDPQADFTKGVARIATGAAVPEAYDAVVQVELSHVEDEQVRFDLQACKPWRNIHKRASDASANDVLLCEGTLLTPPRLGIVAAVGRTQLNVARLPRVTLLTTGDEVMPPDTRDLQPQQIRNSNGPMLRALLATWGVSLHRHVHVPDDPEKTLAAAREALGESNLVITTGGVSVGERDYLPGAWRQLGLDVVLHGVAMKPGKPVFVAQPPGEQEKLVIGLPGNPVSVLTTALLFVQPVIKKMCGDDPALRWRKRILAEQVKPDAKRELFRAAQLNEDESVSVVPWQGSGDLSHTAMMDGLVRLPVADDRVESGASVDWLAL